MERNGTRMLSLGGFIDIDKYRYVYFVFLVAVYILIICSNFIIIYVIRIHRNLHEPMYIFIAALSLNSLFISTTIYPKLIVDVLSHQQSAFYSVCLLQVQIFYSLAAADLMLLSEMAYDRYVSICKPLQYASLMSKTRVCIFLALAWFLPACHVSVSVIIQSKQELCSFILGGIFCNTTIVKIHCTTPTSLMVWGFIVIMDMALVPVLFILFTYIKIFTVAFRSQGEIRTKAIDTCLPHLIVLILFACLIVFDVMIGILETELPKLLRLIMTLLILVCSPMFNPIIYGLKMKEILKHIKKLLSCCNHVEMIQK
nr:olfactory receptor 6N2-like [Nerophis lumbriciformis]